MDLYTDGSCSPNPGKGGYAVVMNGKPVIMGNEKESTNIRMEGKAIIEAIKFSQGNKCRVFTDSQFWINVLEKWIYGWERRGFKGVKNLDIVTELYYLYKNSNAMLIFVKAHAKIEGNELADYYANRARLR